MDQARQARALTEADAEAHIHGICFKTGPPRRVGVELEWLVRERGDPAAPVAADRLRAALAALPGHDHDDGAAINGDVFRGGSLRLPSGAAITIEPGGQVELSSAPAGSLAELIDVTSRDLAVLRDAAAAAGLELCGYGLDPLRAPRRVLDLPRYAAMERFFDSGGTWGRQMMCGTASVQVCVDAGDASDGPAGYRARWRLLHAIGPVLVAAFANSPLRAGAPSGWRSGRQQVWQHLDPGRTRAPGRIGRGTARHGGAGDPRAAWARYALDAAVMCVRRPGSADWTAPPGLRFRDWLRGGFAGRDDPPGAADLEYHLSTLFPPVRPRGHLELRMIDAQPGDGWVVPAAVVTALTEDAQAAAQAASAAAALWDDGALQDDGGNPWQRAARHGPADKRIGQASRDCFGAAAAALDRSGAPASVRDAVGEFTERYVWRDRCPADDLLERGS